MYEGGRGVPLLVCNLAVGWNEWSASRPDRFTLRKKAVVLPEQKMEQTGSLGPCGGWHHIWLAVPVREFVLPGIKGRN